MRVMIFDFDGTLTTGDAPALRYAQEAAWLVAPAERPQYEHDITRDFQARGPERWRGAVDGFDMVRRRAVEYHADDAGLETAYLRSREALARHEIAVTAPDGLPDFLSAITAYRIVVTNSPIVGLWETLDSFGVSPYIDEIRADAGKPDGLREILRGFAEQVGATNVMSIGDIWHNDLAPAFDLGCLTALITHGRPHEYPSSLAANELSELYGPLSRWDRAGDQHS